MPVRFMFFFSYAKETHVNSLPVRMSTRKKVINIFISRTFTEEIMEIQSNQNEITCYLCQNKDRRFESRNQFH